jgi:hypothetical protein
MRYVIRCRVYIAAIWWIYIAHIQNTLYQNSQVLKRMIYVDDRLCIFLILEHHQEHRVYCSFGLLTPDVKACCDGIG